MRKYGCILIDPPWPEERINRFALAKNSRPDDLPYRTMTVAAIARLPVPELSDVACHLWLWTTNRSLPDGFDLIKRWGFKYLCPVHWVKPSGFGAWWVHRSQTLLFAYRDKLVMRNRHRPNVLFANPGRHSEKPGDSYDLIESVSCGPYLEMFARRRREHTPSYWSVWGDEVDSDITITAEGHPCYSS